MKENPQGAVPGERIAVDVAVLVISRAPPSSGVAPGRPGEAEGGTIANDREARIEHRGTRAVTVATVLSVLRSGRGRSILEALGNEGASSGADRTENARHEFFAAPGMDSRIATKRAAGALARMRNAAYQNRGRPQRRTSHPHLRILTRPCCPPACVLS